MAQQDIHDWWVDVSDPNHSILPNGIGYISFSNPVFTIKLIWDDNRDGCINDADKTPYVTGCEDKNADPSFTMEFQV